jgi:capsular exopolysaccharide synthesis family protein
LHTSHEKKEHLLSSSNNKLRRIPQKVSAPAHFLDEGEAEPLQIVSLLRTYLPLGGILILLGALFGAGIVIFETPVYKARVLMEVQPTSATLLASGMDPFAAINNLDAVNLHTQVMLLQSGSTMGNVVDQMRRLPIPPPVENKDSFSKLRMYLRRDAVERSVSPDQAILAAAGSFDVRMITDTRLIELSCESPHPVISAEFLNTIANAFIQGTMKNRSDTSEKTREWLSSHFNETKAKLQSADARLRAFVLRSGNVLAAGDATVDDAKMRQLQGELAAAATSKLSKQAEYETAVQSNIESIPAVVSDSIAAGIRSQLAELERERAKLLSIYLPANPKVMAVEQQQHELEAALKREAAKVIARMKNEYENATRHEKLLLDAYSGESGQVSSLASKAAEYAALRREVDGLRATYDSLLQEMNKTEVSQSAPVMPVRLVDPSVPPAFPYKPRPQTEILLGMIGGLAITVGIAFIREKLDRRLRSPESLQVLVKVPQLGVIPAAKSLPMRKGGLLSVVPGISRMLALPAPKDTALSSSDHAVVARAAWESGISPLADSFRATLASVSRHLGGTSGARVILVTSSTPGEGKTTIVSNLGIALSEAGKNVLVIDTDFRRPSLSNVFELEGDASLPKILEDRRPIENYRLDELVTKTSLPGLYILPCQNAGPKIPTMIYSDRLPQVIERLRNEFDLVIVDAPPILFPADARVIAQLTDGVVLVIRAGYAEKESIRAAVNCLHQDGVPILGTVLNDWVPQGPKSGMRYYNYYYSQKSSGD